VLRTFRSRLLLSIGIGALVFLALSIYANFGKLSDAFARFDWGFLPIVLGLALINYAIRFFKWDFFLRRLDIDVSKSDSFRIYLSGYIMTVTPGKMGEVLKSYLLKKTNGISISRSAPIVIAERYTDFIGMALIALLSMSGFRFGSERFRIEMIVTSFTLISLFLVLVGSRSLSLRMIRLIEKTPLVSRFAHKVETAYESMHTLFTPRSLFYGSANSVASWGCECIGFYFILKGFGAAPATLSVPVFIYAFSTIVGAMVFVLPGGIGATEGSLTGLLRIVNVKEGPAVAATIMIRLCTLWFAVLVGAAALLVNRRRFEGVEELLDSASEEHEVKGDQ